MCNLDSASSFEDKFSSSLAGIETLKESTEDLEPLVDPEPLLGLEPLERLEPLEPLEEVEALADPEPLEESGAQDSS